MSNTVALQEPEQKSALAVLLADPDRLKDFPIETVERLFNLDRQIHADAARQDFFSAFNAVQAEMHPIVKRGKNSHVGSTYARAEELTQMLDPIITRNGFSRSISTEDCKIEDHIRFVLILRHTGGHEERHRLDAPVDHLGIKGAQTKTRLHGMASSYTYCERHLLLKVFGVQTVADDDGNAAAGIGPSSERISEDQVHNIDALADEVAADRRKFLKFFDIDHLAEMRVSDYKTAIRMLEAKR